MIANDAHLLWIIPIECEWCLGIVNTKKYILIVNDGFWLLMMITDCEVCLLIVNDA